MWYFFRDQYFININNIYIKYFFVFVFIKWLILIFLSSKFMLFPLILLIHSEEKK